MGMFGSRGGLRMVVPVRERKSELAAAPNDVAASVSMERGPSFIDLRTQHDTKGLAGVGPSTSRTGVGRKRPR